jgi:hypothetical protein
MIVYIKCHCRASDIIRVNDLEKQGYEVRDIRKNPEWRKESKQYGLRLPFIVSEGVARPLWKDTQ